MTAATCSTWEVIVWERLNKSGKWCPYSPEVSQYLELNSKKNIDNVSLGDVDNDLKLYCINFKDMIQVSEKTGTKCKIRKRLCPNVDPLTNGFIWQWAENDKDSWKTYDIEVIDLIESAFQKGEKKVTLKKLHGHNYEIDLTKMQQINRQTKRKRAVRRVQNSSCYPVEQNTDDSQMEVTRNYCTTNEYPELMQEVPGTSALVAQLSSYLFSVTGNGLPAINENSATPCPPSRKKKKHKKSPETTTNESLSMNSSDQTYALVNGMPWHHAHPPHTPASKLKPVPGLEPLVKAKKRKSKKDKNVDTNKNVDIFDLHTDEVKMEESVNKDLMSENCIICCDGLAANSSYNDDGSVVKLKICSHAFHKGCLEAMYKSGPMDGALQCPTCKKIHGEKCGIQPPGEMTYHVLPYSLPSFHDCDTIRIIYDFKPGTQGPEHPTPGKMYTARGFPRRCYLPDNEMGRKVLRLLIKAWKRRLIFTIGTSSTTGEENTVTWNEIHHKTEFGCNFRGHGYPDPNYFVNVLAELEIHGVKDDDVYLWYKA